jgi:hypothetical protein
VSRPPEAAKAPARDVARRSGRERTPPFHDPLVGDEQVERGLEIGSVNADLGRDVATLAETLADYREDRAGLRPRSELRVEDQPARGHERRAVIGDLIGEKVLEAAVHLCAHDLWGAACDQVGVEGVRAGEAERAAAS